MRVLPGSISTSVSSPGRRPKKKAPVGIVDVSPYYRHKRDALDCYRSQFAPAEAEAVYRRSLMDHRIDGWALFGLEQALKAQGKTAEAKSVKAEFDKAWSMADVKLASSRF